MFRRRFRMGDQMGPEDESGVYHDPLNADQVYIMMKKEFRISRNVRAQWFIEHLNRVISVDANKVC